MRRFFNPVLPTHDGCILLDREPSHHVLRVVGIAPNEEIELFNGQGYGCVARLLGVVNGAAKVKWVSDIGPTQTRPSLTMVLSLTKGDAFSTAIRMTTEMGVSRIIPLLAQRSLPKGDKQERWQKVATSAAGQSKRLLIPIVESLQTWNTIWTVLSENDVKWLLHPAAKEVQPVTQLVQPTVVFVGPEGGFTKQETQCVLENGGEYRTLGPLVLKSDTAAIVTAAQCLGATTPLT